MFRYTSAAQDLVMFARGLPGHGWRTPVDTAASGDDITAFVIPLSGKPLWCLYLIILYTIFRLSCHVQKLKLYCTHHWYISLIHNLTLCETHHAALYYIHYIYTQSDISLYIHNVNCSIYIFILLYPLHFKITQSLN